MQRMPSLLIVIIASVCVTISHVHISVAADSTEQQLQTAEDSFAKPKALHRIRRASYVRYGRNSHLAPMEEEKRAKHYVRFGRDSSTSNKHYVRFGRSYPHEVFDDASKDVLDAYGYGRAAEAGEIPNYLNEYGKQLSDRNSESREQNINDELHDSQSKRSKGKFYVRFGKRDDSDEDFHQMVNKRPNKKHYVRYGRGQDKRAKHYVRFGRSNELSDDTN